MKINHVLKAQKDFFLSEQTKDIIFRKNQLHKLFQVIEEYEERIYDALLRDLNKSEYEAFLTEVSIVKLEIKNTLKHLDRWAAKHKKRMSISTFPCKSYTIYEPYGSVLILSPWNYPFQLTMMPLIGAMAAGNCAVLKLSKSSLYTSRVIQEMITTEFESHYIYVVEDSVSYDQILKEKYDLIFFTGSERVGKIIMRAASEHLTPVVLELGGKSPCIVDQTANLRECAKKILWAKSLNSGQTCVAPDYVVIHEDVKEKFMEEIQREFKENYYRCEYSESYPKIINLHHFMRLARMIDKEERVIGGEKNEKDLKIAPAIIENCSFASPAMKEEIFGPVLPIISYYDLNALLEELKQRPKALACYIFSKDDHTINRIKRELSFGGGCINDCIIHLANHHLPFGGAGSSGMGNYHGKYSFQTFSHEKGILENRGIFDIPHRFHPYTEKKLVQLKALLGLK